MAKMLFELSPRHLGFTLNSRAGIYFLLFFIPKCSEGASTFGVIHNPKSKTEGPPSFWRAEDPPSFWRPKVRRLFGGRRSAIFLVDRRSAVFLEDRNNPPY